MVELLARVHDRLLRPSEHLWERIHVQLSTDETREECMYFLIRALHSAPRKRSGTPQSSSPYAPPLARL